MEPPQPRRLVVFAFSLTWARERRRAGVSAAARRSGNKEKAMTSKEARRRRKKCCGCGSAIGSDWCWKNPVDDTAAYSDYR
jgi:hypothetical protein